jgi:hypothetical protein
MPRKARLTLSTVVPTEPKAKSLASRALGRTLAAPAAAPAAETGGAASEDTAGWLSWLSGGAKPRRARKAKAAPAEDDASDEDSLDGAGRRKRPLARGTKLQVWRGSALRTASGLTKDALMLNKHNKVVSRRQHEAGLKAIERLRQAGYVVAAPRRSSRLKADAPRARAARK